MSYIYIASPYSSPDKELEERRFKQVCKYAGECMASGEKVFSPIAHTHPIAVYHGSLPRGWVFWEQFDRAMLQHAEVLRVLTLPGWESSVGVKAEMEIARELGIPIEYANWKG